MRTQKTPNLYLVGFMGTGKSTVGRLVAQRLGLEFIDSDHAIEAAQGRGIPEIFASEGEASFRAMERSLIENGLPADGCLVSCGGGLVVQPGMMDLVRGKGLVFALIASPEAIYERTKGGTNRPLLNTENPLERIRELLAQREPIYRQAHVQILTEGRVLGDVVGHVCRSYKLEAAQWA